MRIDFRRLKDGLPIYIAFFCITLSWSNFFINAGMQKLLEYIGLACILIGIYDVKCKKNTKLFSEFCIVIFFFSIGLIMQDLEIAKKLNALISMFILASIAIMPCRYIGSYNNYIGIKNSILIALLISFILCLLTKKSIIMAASEGVLVRYGFTAGIEHRNYLSYMLLCVFFIEYLGLALGKKKNYYFLLFVLLLILLTNSRSSWILIFLFFTILNLSKIRVLKSQHRLFATIIILSVFFLGIAVFQYLKEYSWNFFYRVNGLKNYLTMYAGDIKHIFWGNLQIAYLNPSMSYDENIRNVIGMNGSVELVILNILLKNGILGFIGYYIIFQRYLKNIRRIQDDMIRQVAISATVCFVTSAFVESYVANINHLYSIFMYVFLSNILKLDNE